MVAPALVNHRCRSRAWTRRAIDRRPIANGRRWAGVRWRHRWRCLKVLSRKHKSCKNSTNTPTTWRTRDIADYQVLSGKWRITEEHPRAIRSIRSPFRSQNSPANEEQVRRQENVALWHTDFLPSRPGYEAKNTIDRETNNLGKWKAGRLLLKQPVRRKYAGDLHETSNILEVSFLRC
jgi:hypothetical protein